MENGYVHCEQGLTDESNVGQYSVSGCKDEMGILLQHTSLKLLLRNCTDLAEEEVLLQSKGTQGVLIDWTPKFFCELAGEGIIYSRGYTKNYY
jgi:hypothetical protein